MITPQEFFNLLSDETRLRCLLLLYQEKKLCVCELTCALGIIQPKISRHLSLLRKSGLVLDERKGQWVYYRLNGQLESWMKQVLNAILKDLKKREPFLSDFAHILHMNKKSLCKNGGI